MTGEQRIVSVHAWASQPIWTVVESREEFGGDGVLLSLSAARGVRERIEGEGRAASEDVGGYRRVLPGDLVINRLVAREGAFAVSQLEGLISPAYWVLKPKAPGDGRWLEYVLRSAPYMAELARISKFMPPAQFDLPWEQFRAVPVPWPPATTRKRIVDFLDSELSRIDALVEAKRELVGLYHSRRLATLESMISSPENSRPRAEVPWIRQIPEQWPALRISYLADVFNGSTPESGAGEGDVAWITSGDVDQGLVTEPSGHITEAVRRATGLRLAPVGSVVVGLVGQGRTRGLSAELGITTTLNQNVAAIVPRDARLSPAFLHVLLELAYLDLRNEGRGSNQAALNCEILKAYRIPVPPVDLQTAVVRESEASSRVERDMRMMLQRSVDLLSERRQALITAAVAGQLELLEPAA